MFVLLEATILAETYINLLNVYLNCVRNFMFSNFNQNY